MKRIMVLLFIAFISFGLVAEDKKIAPTQAIVDFLVSQGVDAAALQAAKSSAPSEALFLAPGAPTKEALAKIDQIVDAAPLDTTDPVYVALGYDPHERLNDLVYSELMKRLPADKSDLSTYSMQIGNVVWTLSNGTPDDDDVGGFEYDTD